jgi:hypothetical protein
MVLALRENRKTQTRRTRGLDKINAEPDAWELLGEVNQQSGRGKWCFGNSAEPDDDASIVTIRCPCGVSGDRLWTRENWRALADYDFRMPRELVGDWIEFFYEADGPLTAEIMHGEPGKLRPGMFLPRWASRDTLEVVSARPERLQAITKDDALAEGIQVLPLQSSDDPSAWYQSAPGVHQCRTAVDSFRQLWDSLNGKTLPWSKNPWAWRVEFRGMTA